MNIFQKAALKMVGLGGFTAFEGANYSTARSFIVAPTLDQKQQIDSYSRVELLRRYHWLRNNIGLVRRLVNGSVRYAVGQGIAPKSMSKDEPWNVAADEWFNRVASNKALFDYEGRIDYYRAQIQVGTTMAGEGEIFTNCVEPAGKGDYIPKFQLLAPARINGAFGASSKAGLSDDECIIDGLVLDKASTRVKRYRVPNQPTDPNPKDWVDLDADNVIHTYDPERVGQLRGITWLYHGVNSLIDMLDLTSLEKHAVKVHSTLAAVVKNKIGNAGNSGLTGQLSKLLTTSQMQAAQANDPTLKNQLLQKIFGGGLVPFLSPDEELELLSSDRPSPVFTGFLDWLVRDIAWGFGVSPEFIWAVAGMGGANTRYILADAQWFFTYIGSLIVNEWAQPVRLRMLSAAMLANQRNPKLGIPQCKDPNWMAADAVHWQRPPKITADAGKEAQANIDLLANGMQTWNDYWGGLGADGDRKVVERITEVADAMVAVKNIAKAKGLDPETELTYAAVFPMGADAPKAVNPPKMVNQDVTPQQPQK